MADHQIVLGIDLGTTYSAVAYIDNAGTPQILPNTDNERTTPSVAYVSGKTVVVGRVAKEMAQTAPKDTVQYVKSYIGRRRKQFVLGGEQWSPEEISAMILRKVVNDARIALGTNDPLTHAVITVPAFFNEQQRKSTEDAGRIAGLKVLRVINEPTAAALAYGFHQLGNDQTILVYDLGGGTFDITIMRIEGNLIRMMATDGDVQLGGKDWDQRIIDYAAEQFITSHGVDPRDEADSYQELIAQAEQAKVRLSKLPETRFAISCGGQRETITLSRDKFEEISQDLIAQTETTLRLTIEDAGLTFNDIDECLIVGGSTRMKSVQNIFERLIGKTPHQILNPDECVAQGAAIHAVMTQLRLYDNGADMLPPDVRPEALERFRLIEESLINPHTLGIKALDASGKPVVAPVIPRATHVPCREVRRFQTSRPGQTQIRITVMEGESSNPEAATEVGACIVRDLPENLAQGTPIEVLFEYTQDSRINVSARLPTVQAVAQTDIQRASGLTPEQIRLASERIRQLRIE